MRKRLLVHVGALHIALLLAAAAHGADTDRSRNAADVYRSAFKLIDAIPNELTRAQYEENDDGVRPLSEQQKKLVAATDEVMRLVAEGNRVERCEWEESFFKNPYTWGLNEKSGTGLARSRMVARFACLRARSLFDRGEAEKAIDEMMTAWTLGRRLSRGGTLISVLVQISIDAMFLSEFATRLPAMDRKTRTLVKERMEALPKADGLRDAAERERQSVVRWFREDVPKDVDARVAEWEAFYRKLNEFWGPLPDGKKKEFDPTPYRAAAAMAKADKQKYLEQIDAFDKAWQGMMAATFAAPPEKLDETAAGWERKLDASNVMSTEWRGVAVDAVAKLPLTEHRIVVLHAMMKAGMAVLDEGDDALKKHREPYSDALFRMEKFEGGFELFSTKYKSGLEPWSLRFGRKGK